MNRRWFSQDHSDAGEMNRKRMNWWKEWKDRHEWK